MAYKLYNAPQSTCSQRVRFVLNAKGLAFAEEKLDLLAGDQLKPEYLALNPNGVVPTLDHDGNIVIDSSVIMEYLDEIEPGVANFTPRDPAKRAAMRALMRFIDEMPAAAVRVPTFNLAFQPRFAAMSEEQFVAFAESKPLRKEFMLAIWRWGGWASRRRTWTMRWHACGGRTSAWSERSARAVGHGCWGRTLRLPMSRCCRRLCEWQTWDAKVVGPAYRASLSGTNSFAPIPRSSQPTIRGRC
jgi:glutathione S-transferase